MRDDETIAVFKRNDGQALYAATIGPYRQHNSACCADSPKVRQKPLLASKSRIGGLALRHRTRRRSHRGSIVLNRNTQLLDIFVDSCLLHGAR